MEFVLAYKAVVHGGTKEQTVCKEISEAGDLQEEFFGMFLVKILSKSPVKEIGL